MHGTGAFSSPADPAHGACRTRGTRGTRWYESRMPHPHIAHTAARQVAGRMPHTPASLVHRMDYSTETASSVLVRQVLLLDLSYIHEYPLPSLCSLPCLTTSYHSHLLYFEPRRISLAR